MKNKVTLTIEFTRYDGTEETLPPRLDRQYMVATEAGLQEVALFVGLHHYTTIRPDSGILLQEFAGYEWRHPQGAFPFQIGDLWAPWPVMEREVGNG